jgi:hypothetical protein
LASADIFMQASHHQGVISFSKMAILPYNEKQKVSWPGDWFQS